MSGAITTAGETVQYPGSPAYPIAQETVDLLSRPDTEAGRLQRAVLACLLRHQDEGELPTGGRFLFYELEQAGCVSKAKVNPTTGRKVQRPDAPLTKALTHLRKAGIVPWEWIADESRNLSAWESAATVADYLVDSIAAARIDAWGGEPEPLVICESKATAGVLTSLATEYLVPIAGTGGQCGGFLHTDLAPILKSGQRPVLYLGDYDLAGGHIEANTLTVLESKVGPLDWRRVAITEAQIDERGLEPIHKTDKRFAGGLPQEAWEVEALGQSTVKRLLREKLDELLPEPIEAVREREREQRSVATEMLRAAGGRS